MQNTIQALKTHVADIAGDPAFRHHDWFVTYHLEVVERIAKELLAHYPEADADLVEVMVWMHDYGKILDFDRQYDRALVDVGRDKLIELGFAPDFASRAADYIEWMDKRSEVDLHKAPIEVQIVSSADGGSHFASPFHPIYYHENPDKPLAGILAGKPQRISIDWERKITLPEARAAFAPYYEVTKVQNGQLPQTFLSALPKHQ